MKVQSNDEMTNSANPDQQPSDLGLYCLQKGDFQMYKLDRNFIGVHLNLGLFELP